MNSKIKNEIISKKTASTFIDHGFSEMFDCAVLLQPYLYFYKTCKKVASVDRYKNIDFHKFLKALNKEFGLKSDAFIWNKSFDQNEDKFKINQLLIKIADDCMIYLEHSRNSEGTAEILYSSDIEDYFLDFISAIVKNNISPKEPINKINLLYIDSSNSLCLKEFELKRLKLNLLSNYNDDFLPIHKEIIEKLSQQFGKGIVLLHGPAGTGKTSYIRYLASIVKKQMIYIPADMTGQIASPNFLSLMIDNPNSILIIEDAESVLRDRITAKNVSVSNLLNMADGLLSDCLNVQLVCTFNTEISSIDQALLRKGRIIAKYEFKPLTIEKSNKLFKELKIKNCTRSQMTLAEIYNQTAPSFNENKFNKIGFN